MLDQLSDGFGGSFLNLIRCFPAHVAIYDGSLEGVVFSRDFCDLMGWREDQMTGRAWQHLVHPEDLNITAGFAENTKQPKRTCIVNRWRSADGSYKTLSWTVVPWEHVGNGVEYSICVAREVRCE